MSIGTEWRRVWRRELWQIGEERQTDRQTDRQRQAKKVL
jgi:hypothetical protein